MNLHTLHIEHAILLCVYTLLTAANSLSYRELKGVHWFTLYNVLALLGALAILGRHNIPDFLSIAVGNIVVIAAYFVLFLSLSELLGRKRLHLWPQIVVATAGMAAMLYWGYFHPDTPARLFAFSSVLGVQQLIICVVILRAHDRGNLLATLPLSISLAALSAVNFTRLLFVVSGQVPQDYLQSGPAMAWAVLFNTCLQCGTVVAYVWMTAAMLRRDLELQATTDPLTGLLNRRAISLAASRAIAGGCESGAPLSAIIVDLDDFKPVNDTFGHECGDSTLVAVAHCLRDGIRTGDLLARMGGDEFAVLLPRTEPVAATEIAERLRASVAALQVVYPSGPSRIAASFGVGHCNGSCTWPELVHRCDEALYRVKRCGGNMVAVAGEELPFHAEHTLATIDLATIS